MQHRFITLGIAYFCLASTAGFAAPLVPGGSPVDLPPGGPKKITVVDIPGFFADLLAKSPSSGNPLATGIDGKKRQVASGPARKVVYLRIAAGEDRDTPLYAPGQSLLTLYAGSLLPTENDDAIDPAQASWLVCRKDVTGSEHYTAQWTASTTFDVEKHHEYLYILDIANSRDLGRDIFDSFRHRFEIPIFLNRDRARSAAAHSVVVLGIVPTGYTDAAFKVLMDHRPTLHEPREWDSSAEIITANIREVLVMDERNGDLLFRRSIPSPNLSHRGTAVTTMRGIEDTRSAPFEIKSASWRIVWQAAVEPTIGYFKVDVLRAADNSRITTAVDTVRADHGVVPLQGPGTFRLDINRSVYYEITIEEGK